MKKWIIIAATALVCVGVSEVISPRVAAYWTAHNRIRYKEVEAARGDIAAVVNAAGTVQPMLRVYIGSFVSGPISELLVTYNDRVKEGQILARFDPRIYKAAVARDEAALAMAKANAAKAAALLEQAKLDEQRAEKLRAINKEYLADTTMDQYKYNRISMEADLETAKAAVAQAKAALANSQANLDYTEITSPVDGIVLERKISKGQTFTSQFTTPELFVLATEMDRYVKVYAAVNEADIGYIRAAEKQKRPVVFTVDAYPRQLFAGEIYQIQMNPAVEQNVVTYPVVLKTPNPEMKLIPGMTANITFKIDERKNVLKIPNAALRFYPEREQVCEEDADILTEPGNSPSENDAEEFVAACSASDIPGYENQCKLRYVWTTDGERLKAVAVTIGISDNKFSEVVGGNIQPGQKFVAGIED